MAGPYGGCCSTSACFRVTFEPAGPVTLIFVHPLRFSPKFTTWEVADRRVICTARDTHRGVREGERGSCGGCAPTQGS